MVGSGNVSRPLERRRPIQQIIAEIFAGLGEPAGPDMNAPGSADGDPTGDDGEGHWARPRCLNLEPHLVGFLFVVVEKSNPLPGPAAATPELRAGPGLRSSGRTRTHRRSSSSFRNPGGVRFPKNSFGDLLVR